MFSVQEFATTERHTMDTDNLGWEFVLADKMLPAEYKDTDLYFLLSYLVEGIYTQQEIAEFMGVSGATISAWTVKLHKIIDENDPNKLWFK